MDAFVTPAQLRARMGLDAADTDNEVALASALMGTQFEMQVMLGSELGYSAEVTDVFLPELALKAGATIGGMMCLRLSRMLLTGSALVYTSESYPLDADWTLLDASEYVVYPERGEVRIYPEWDEFYVKVVYSAGMETPVIPAVPETTPITGVEITTAGSGYDDGTYPLVVVTSTGSGFAGEVDVVSGAIDDIRMTDAGTGYADTDVLAEPLWGSGVGGAIGLTFGATVPEVPASLDYSQVPDWMTEAILLLAPVMMILGPTTKWSASMKAQAVEARTAALSVVPVKYRRPTAFAYQPL